MPWCIWFLRGGSTSVNFPPPRHLLGDALPLNPFVKDQVFFHHEKFLFFFHPTQCFTKVLTYSMNYLSDTHVSVFFF